MYRRMFKSKIHRATVTEANLHYEGSITIDAQLMEAANILPSEHVHVWNITRGTRLETYTMKGESGSGVICINGAAAHHNKPSDMVIIATFADFSEAELVNYKPTVVLVDEKNRIASSNHVETAQHSTADDVKNS